MSSERTAPSSKKIHPSLKRSVWPRVIAYALGSPLVMSMLPEDAGWVRWAVVFFGFVYPTLYFLLGVRVRNTRLVGFAGYYIDALLWGLAVVATHYSIVMVAVAPLLFG